MITLALDPTVVAAPRLNDATILRGYVERLLHWNETASLESVKVCIPLEVAGLLVEHGLYPIRPILEENLVESGVHEYDANTISVLAETLLNSPALEDEIRVAELLYDSLALVPDIYEFCEPRQIADASIRLAAVIAILTFLSARDRAFGLGMATTLGEVNEVELQCRLHEIEHERDDMGSVPLYPNTFTGRLKIYRRFDECLGSMNPVDLWIASTSSSDMAIAINVAVLKSRNRHDHEPLREIAQSYRIHERFFESVQNLNGFNNAPLSQRIMRSIVETIERQNLRATHVLRTGAGGDDPPRVRGLDKAFRRDVDHDVHLHYWACASGQIEFASIVHHNDFSIPA